MAYTGYINPEVAKMYGIPYSELTAEQRRILHADSVRRAKLIKERQDAVLKNNLKAFEDEAKMERVLASIYKDCQKQILADVTATIAKVKKAGGDWSYANQSALTRSRGLFEQITAELNKLGQKEQILFYNGLSNIYTDQFLRQVYEIGQSIPVKANFNRLNPALVKKTLDYPWSGAMFSDRLWNDKETLGKNLRVGLTQSMILGEGIPEITDRINKNIDTARYNAERVARTETKRVTYCAHNDSYEELGVEELEYHTAGERSSSAVCSICNADRGKRFKRGEEPTLPRHPNCKCVYIPVVSDEFGDNELNELTGSIRGAENYEKWKETYAEAINPDGSYKEGWGMDFTDGKTKYTTADGRKLTLEEYKKEKANPLTTPPKTDNLSVEPVTEKSLEKSYEDAYNKYTSELERVRSTGAVNRVTNSYLDSVGSNLTRVDLGELDLATAKEVSKALVDLDSKWVSTLQEVEVVDYLGVGTGGMCTPYIDKWERTGLDKDLYSRIKYAKTEISPAKALKYWEQDKKSFPSNANSLVDRGNYLLQTIYHEYGHSILGGKVSELCGTNAEVYEKVKKIESKYKNTVRNCRKTIQDIQISYAGNDNYYDLLDSDPKYKKAQEELSKLFVSKYANSSTGEFIAECFANASLCSNPSPYSVEVLELLKAYFGK